MLLLVKLIIRDALKKKIAEKETLVHMGGRGLNKSPFFGSSKRGHILMGGGFKIFLSNVPCFHFCASVSTKFVVFLEEALHYENFLCSKVVDFN